MKILVTGATGFIGSHLVESFLTDHEVAILKRPNSKVPEQFSQEGVVSYIYDGTYDSVKKAFLSFQPELVIHLASYYVYDHQEAEVDTLIQSNIQIGAYILEAMKQTGTRYLVNTGTSFEHFGDSKNDTVNLYAATKKAFGELCKYYCEAGFIKAITLKLFDTYGDRDPRKKLLGLLKESLESGQEILLSPGEQIIDILHISDVLDAYDIAINEVQSQSSPYSEYGLSGNERCTLKELVKQIEVIANGTLNIQWGARPYRDREVMTPWDSHSKLPGWAPKISLEVGLESFLNE